MAKSVSGVSLTVLNKTTGLSGVDKFETQRSRLQLGSTVFVPSDDMLLIIADKISFKSARTGSQEKATVAHRIPVVRLVDGVPVDVIELFVGQMVKRDANSGAYVFNNNLVTAFNQGSDAFKAHICGNVLSVVDEKLIQDKIWDKEAVAWKRDPETKELITAEKNALEFAASEPSSSLDLDLCYEKLLAYYESNCKAYVTINRSSNVATEE